MAIVNDKNYIRYSGFDGETVNMIESAEDANDRINLKKMKEPTTIVGGAGKDKIWGSKKHINYIFGDGIWEFDPSVSSSESEYKLYSGKDIIHGGNSVDIIHGGLGNDKMYGQDGINIFQFKKGDGKDTIVMGKGDDYLYFKDSDLSELTYIQKNKDLIVKYSDSDQVTVKDYFKTFGHVSLKGIADKSLDAKNISDEITKILLDYKGDSEWQLSRLENKVENYLQKALKNLPSPKSLYEGTGLTIVRTKGGESKGTDADDIITGSKKKDKLYGRGGNDIINGGKGNDYIEGGSGNDVIDGGKGSDKIYGNSGSNVITGGKGNDKIYSGSGSDVFVYSKGAGKDVIYNSTSSDTLKYTDVASMGELKFERKNNNLIVTRKNGAKKETVTLSKYFNSSYKLDKVTFANGTSGSILESALLTLKGAGTINGSEFNEIIKGSYRADVIYGKGGNDRITGYKGKDTINAGGGTNTLYFRKNDGDDVVLSGGGVDTLLFRKEDWSDIRARYSGNNVILYHKGGTVTLKGYKKGGHSAQYIQIGSTVKSIDDLLPYQTINTSDVNVINGTDLKDKIVVSDFSAASVNAKAGNDYIEINTGDVDVNGGKGDDTIKLNAGNNKLHFRSGDGKDTITENIGMGDFNTYVFEDETSVDNLKFTKTSSGYTIGYNGGKDKVTVIQSGSSVMYDPDEDLFGLGDIENADVVKIKGGSTFVVSNKGLLKLITGNNATGTSGSDYFDSTASTVRAYEGNDYINLSSNNTTKVYAGKGNDQILIGTDTTRSLYFNSGDGNDVVYDEYAGGRTNSLKYVLSDETSFDNISVTSEGKNVRITYNNGKDSILIKSADIGASSDLSENDYGSIVINNVEKAISSYFETSEPAGAPRYNINQIKAETVGFTSSGNSDVPSQLVDNNEQDLSTLVSTYTNTDNTFAFV